MRFGKLVTVVLKQGNRVINLFLYRERLAALAAVAQVKTRLLQEVGFVPDGQFVFLRKLDGSRWADFFTARAENAAPKVEGPRQLPRHEVGFHR